MKRHLFWWLVVGAGFFLLASPRLIAIVIRILNWELQGVQLFLATIFWLYLILVLLLLLLRFFLIPEYRPFKNIQQTLLVILIPLFVYFLPLTLYHFNVWQGQMVAQDYTKQGKINSDYIDQDTGYLMGRLLRVNKTDSGISLDIEVLFSKNYNYFFNNGSLPETRYVFVQPEYAGALQNKQIGSSIRGIILDCYKMPWVFPPSPPSKPGAYDIALYYCINKFIPL